MLQKCLLTTGVVKSEYDTLAPMIYIYSTLYTPALSKTTFTK